MDNPASTDTLTGNIGHTGRRQQTITQKTKKMFNKDLTKNTGVNLGAREG
jgi:hypothetical protein